jgi:hypothetical protein
LRRTRPFSGGFFLLAGAAPAWYQPRTGFTPDAAHFGAHAITPMTDTLFIGHSPALPV